MADASTEATDEFRTAELIGSLCLATDLGMGFPFEHGLQTTLIAMRLAERLGVDRHMATEVYYASLLSHAGCTTEVHVAAEIFGSSMTEHFHPVMYGTPRESFLGLVRSLPEPDVHRLERTAQIARRLPRMAREAQDAISANCEVAGMLAGRTGAPPSVPDMLAFLTDRWDGKGPLRRARGEQIPLVMRIVHVAVDAAFQRLIGGPEHARDRIAERSGHAFDPEIASCLVQDSAGILASVAEAWDAVLDVEPAPHRWMADVDLDRGLAAMGRFADLVSPNLTGHSAAVAVLAERAAEHVGMPASEVTTLRRAGWVHDIGRVAVHARIWNKPGQLDADEVEQVRLHPYYTDRVLSRSGFLATLAPVACAHHERVDGSGYHRGAPAAQLPLTSRLLAAAVAYQSKCEPRRYRTAFTPEGAVAHVAGEANAGRLDPDAVSAVVAAAGQPVPELTRVAGLTEREAQVVALLARGHLTRQVARALHISTKTADRHIQNAYRKIGVSSRAAATLFAAEHGLLAWGELPIGRPPAES
jgi:HD-GYP domain-containing protein (c-di-GMP phosphodiesterase class II)